MADVQFNVNTESLISIPLFPRGGAMATIWTYYLQFNANQSFIPLAFLKHTEKNGTTHNFHQISLNVNDLLQLKIKRVRRSDYSEIINDDDNDYETNKKDIGSKEEYTNIDEGEEHFNSNYNYDEEEINLNEKTNIAKENEEASIDEKITLSTIANSKSNEEIDNEKSFDEVDTEVAEVLSLTTESSVTNSKSNETKILKDDNLTTLSPTIVFRSVKETKPVDRNLTYNLIMTIIYHGHNDYICRVKSLLLSVIQLITRLLSDIYCLLYLINCINY